MFLTNITIIYTHLSILQFYDDKNVTQIDQNRFTKEHCDDVCYQNYTMTDLVYWGVHLGCWNEASIYLTYTCTYSYLLFIQAIDDNMSSPGVPLGELYELNMILYRHQEYLYTNT